MNPTRLHNTHWNDYLSFWNTANSGYVSDITKQRGYYSPEIVMLDRFRPMFINETYPIQAIR